MKCKGRDIDPDFRENYCGQKRVVKGFPCCICEFQEKGDAPHWTDEIPLTDISHKLNIEQEMEEDTPKPLKELKK